MFKYIQNISTNESTILLYDQIGSSIDEFGNICNGIDGSLFASELLYLQDKCEKINVRINSIGGNVLEGYSIISAILNSKKPVETYIDGLAASISGVIAMAGSKVCMMDYGTLMLHNPSGGENKEVLNLVKNTLVTIFKNRTKLSEQEISDMMEKETWLDSDSAKEMGMVDEIISSGKKIDLNKNDSLYNMALVYNKIIKPENKMKNILNTLKMDENSTEEQVVETIESLNDKVNNLLNEVETLKAESLEKQTKLDAIDAAKEAENAAKIEEMVNSFKLEGSEKEKAIALAKVDFDSVKNMLSKTIVAEPAKPFKVENIKKDGEDKSTWTMREWEKKDPKGLEKIANENPELFNEMYKTQYNVK